jgi:hypothetical protein
MKGEIPPRDVIVILYEATHLIRREGGACIDDQSDQCNGCKSILLCLEFLHVGNRADDKQRAARWVAPRVYQLWLRRGWAAYQRWRTDPRWAGVGTTHGRRPCHHRGSRSRKPPDALRMCRNPRIDPGAGTVDPACRDRTAANPACGGTYNSWRHDTHPHITGI